MISVDCHCSLNLSQLILLKLNLEGKNNHYIAPCLFHSINWMLISARFLFLICHCFLSVFKHLVIYVTQIISHLWSAIKGDQEDWPFYTGLMWAVYQNEWDGSLQNFFFYFWTLTSFWTDDFSSQIRDTTLAWLFSRENIPCVLAMNLLIDYWLLDKSRSSRFQFVLFLKIWFNFDTNWYSNKFLK